MKILQTIPTPAGRTANYRVQEGEHEASVAGYALVEFKSGKRGIRPIIDWGQQYGVPDILGRDGNVILEDEQ